jgi:quercetin dioxygenase-like cupin family protein
MKITRIRNNHEDGRGTIRDILTDEPIEHVTVITSAKGATRGHHFHERTMQWCYLMQGRLKLLTQMPGEPVKATVLEPGELALTVPFERHAITAIEDSVFIVLTRGPRGGDRYESDTVRLQEPLRED